MQMVASTPYLDIVGVVQSEPVIDALWQHNHVTFLQSNPDPLLILVSYIKVAWYQHVACVKLQRVV